MSREEIIKLLERLADAYPNTKNKGASSLVSTWEMFFGEYPAEIIYRAAKLHMERSMFFPTIAEIKLLIPRAQIFIDSENHEKLMASSDTKKLESGSHEKESDDWLEEFCKFVGLGYETDLDI